MTEFEIVTLGCRLNTYESSLIEQQLQELKAQDVAVVNTCAVTAESVRQCKQAIRKLKRAQPEKRIVVTGCASHIEKEVFQQMPEVHSVVDNDKKLNKQAWAHALGVPLSDSVALKGGDVPEAKVAPQARKRVRSFVEIQNGCDHRCTFCIIPYGRGASRSRDPHEIVGSIEKLLHDGYQEITLTGVDLTSYYNETIGSLGALVGFILQQVPQLLRLRLSSLDVAEIDEELFALICHHPRLMPHVHLSLQAGDNMILKRMKRRHSREQAIAFCARARDIRPELTFGADFIAGFPTETEEMFYNTLKLVEECDLTWLHVFPFSAREGTPAARMPQNDVSVSKERAARLRALGDAQVKKLFMRQVANEARGQLLMETKNLGRSQDFSPVFISQEAFSQAGMQQVEPGSIIDCSVVGYNEKQLLGKPLQKMFHVEHF